MNSQHIAIEVARDEHFKSNFLKSLKESWPSLAKDYRHYCHVYNPHQGDVWVWTSPEGQKFFHFIIENEDDQKISEDQRLHFFRLALKKVKKIAADEKIENLEIPSHAFYFKSESSEVVKVVNEVLADSSLKIKFN